MVASIPSIPSIPSIASANFFAIPPFPHFSPLEEPATAVKLWFFELKPFVRVEIVPTYKPKTHKSTKKRVRLTATGKCKHRKAGTSHLAISKPAKKIRQLRGTRVLEPQFQRAVHDALRGYSY